MTVTQVLDLVEVSGRVLSLLAKARAGLNETDRAVVDRALADAQAQAEASYQTAVAALAARAAEG